MPEFIDLYNAGNSVRETVYGLLVIDGLNWLDLRDISWIQAYVRISLSVKDVS